MTSERRELVILRLPKDLAERPEPVILTLRLPKATDLRGAFLCKGWLIRGLR